LQGEQTQQAETDQTAVDKRESGHRRRLPASAARDAIADARDLAADARDRAAADLDRELEGREIRLGEPKPSAAEARVRAVVERDQAAEDRRGAAGLADLDHEIDRARRDTGLLAVAYVDIVGLKRVNDTRGHSAGDELLKNTVSVIRDHLRSYDAIVRLGGDEFLCILAGASLVAARRRFEGIEASLRARPGRPAIKVGLASLAPEHGLGSDRSGRRRAPPVVDASEPARLRMPLATAG
jgi:diguanylate cyclase (GGDEF)-like protein